MKLSDEKKDDINRLIWEGFSITRTSVVLGLKRSTVSKFLKRQRDRGNSVCLRSGRPPLKILLPQHLAWIRASIEMVTEVPLNILQSGLMHEFNLRVSISTIHRAIERMDLTVKRTHRIPYSRNSPENIERRRLYAEEFQELLLRYSPEQIFYIDETGFQVSMRSGYGRAPRGQRAITLVPKIKSKNFSVCAGMSAGRMSHTKFNPYHSILPPLDPFYRSF